jgi:uncharacterized lipoprotein YajG
MRTISTILLVVGIVTLGGCAQEPRIVHGSNPVGYGQQSRYPRQPDQLTETARDARSVESIASSVSRIGRLLAGGY